MNQVTSLVSRGAALLVDELRGLAARDVRHPGVLSGRGGVAYGLWRAGVAADDADLLVTALRWTELAIALHRRGVWRPRPWSLQLGYTGYHFVTARIASTLGDRLLRHDAIAAFVESASQVIDRGSPDLYEGAAGCLAATAVLLRDGADVRLAALGRALLARVLAELRRPVRRSSRHAGLAYGRGGLALAALEWSHATGRALPAWLWARLRRMTRAPGAFASQRSWCNGPPGLIATWARAFELTGDRQFLAIARELGHASTAPAPLPPTLCCGPAGTGYSLLALHRIDADAGWQRHAEIHALTALAAEPGFAYRHAYGLTKGKIGVMCLALDLGSRSHAGIPGIQA